MKYIIYQLAKSTGLSSRTLRYYDEIGLLKPAYLNPSGYRIYCEEEINRLQEILYFRQMGLPLATIKTLLQKPYYQRKETLQDHLIYLQEKQKEIAILIATVKRSILEEEGKIKMKDLEKFKGLKKQILQENEKKYGQEIRQKYGVQTITASNTKWQNLTGEEYIAMQNLAQQIQKELKNAVQNKENPQGPIGEKIAIMHQKWLQYT